MAKKSRSTSRTRPKPSSDSGWGSALAKGLFQPGRLMVLAAAIVTAMLIRVTVGWLPDIADRDEYVVKAANVEVTPPPRMVPPNFVQQAFDRSDLPQRLSLLDDSLTQRVHDALQRHPWVAKVDSVSKQTPGGLWRSWNIAARWRWSKSRGAFIPIDRLRHVAPPADFTVSDAQQYPLVDRRGFDAARSGRDELGRPGCRRCR